VKIDKTTHIYTISILLNEPSIFFVDL